MKSSSVHQEPVLASIAATILEDCDAPRAPSSRFASRALLLLSASLLVLIVGWMDWNTGWELSLFLFYAVPILLVVWRGDRFTAILFALICALVWWLANENEHPYATEWGYTWATLSRLAYFLFVAVGGAALRVRHDADRELIRALTRARELERDILRISEEEQRRIGHDLHDGLCQFLAGIKCALGIVRHDLEKRGVPQYAELREIEKLLKEAVTQARDLARGISPVLSGEFGLAVALEEMVENSSKLYPQEVHFEMTREVVLQDSGAALHLYRIAQEALSNAVRHSGAKKITVSLSGDDHSITLQIQDDGCGLDGHDRNGRGMGLRTMEYRSRAVGATLRIQSHRDGGASVSCVMPRTSPASPDPAP